MKILRATIIKRRKMTKSGLYFEKSESEININVIIPETCKKVQRSWMYIVIEEEIIV